MRNTVLLLAALGSTLSAAKAQTTIGKGSGLLTGSVGYHTDTDEVSSTGINGSSSSSTVTYGTFKLDFAVGGFVADNLALGLQLSHTVTGGSIKNSNNSQPAGPPTASALRVGPMVQYYKMLGEHFGLTAMLGAGFESNVAVHQSTLYYNGYPGSYYYSTMKATGYYAALTPGIIFFPIPKFGLTATVGSLAYNRLKVKDNSQAGSTAPEETLCSFNAGFGFSQLQFGATYFFGRK